MDVRQGDPLSSMWLIFLVREDYNRNKVAFIEVFRGQ